MHCIIMPVQPPLTVVTHEQTLQLYRFRIRNDLTVKGVVLF